LRNTPNSGRRAGGGAATALVLMSLVGCAAASAPQYQPVTAQAEFLSSSGGAQPVVGPYAIGDIERSVQDKVTESRPAGASPSASGFFVGNGRYFLTNAHVVLPCQTISITGLNGAPVQAFVVGVDARIDAALLRPRTSPRRGVEFGEAERMDAVRILGFPDYASVNEPAVEMSGRVIDPGTASIHDPMSLQAGLRPGSSGSAVIGPDGRVVGLVIGRRSEQNGVAANTEQLRDFLLGFDIRIDGQTGGGIGGLFGRRDDEIRFNRPMSALRDLVRPVQCED
jgi:S1-C subfamily serine protease